MDENINQQPQFNTPQQFTQPPQEDKANALLAILSFFIPLVGLILYLTQKSDKPKAAKTYGKCALAAVIIEIILCIIITVAGGSLFIDAVEDEPVDNSSYSDEYSNEIDAADVDRSDSVIGEYECVVKSAEKCTDWAGKDAVTIVYEFTNNSASEISFDVALDAKAYQDGVALETTWLDNDETDLIDAEIKPGVTKEVRKAYVLRDSAADIEVEVSELISFSDDKIVTKVKLG